MLSTRSFAHAVTHVVLTALAAASAWAADPLPVADFFRRPDFAEMVMSPNGQKIAATVLGKNGRVALVILDPQDLTRSKNIARYEDADITDVGWVNDKRLLYSLTDRQVAATQQPRPGRISIDVEGKEKPSRITSGSVRLLLQDGSEDVLVERNAHSGTGDWRDSYLSRVNTRTGQSVGLSRDEPDHVWWRAFDPSGAARALLTYQVNKTILHWKTATDQPWVVVREFEAYGSDGPPGLVMVDGNNHLYLVGRFAKERDTQALVRVDMRAPGFNPITLIALDGYDFNGALRTNGQGTVLGADYVSDGLGTHWFSPAMAQIQSKIDALMPDTSNQISCGVCESPAYVLVRSFSDRQPVKFLLFDVKAGTLQALASSRPWIKSTAMARRDLVRIQARDGLVIPVHVTRPLGQQGPAPMVVLVHDGPWVRGGEWQWLGRSQFLASRGYVVIEPEFRGSAGFGEKHYQAGFKQWGLAMQDDIADVTRWAIKQAYADPTRVCIAGAGYGGYSTLMGLIRYPELYRCGFQWGGVTDIDLMYSGYWSNFVGPYKNYGMPMLIGDRVKDAEQLAATSPIKLASKLTQPILMAYGENDAYVPLVHGERLRDALRPMNKQVEWVIYDGEGHGWWSQANDIDFWTRVEKFLARNLKDAP